MGKEPNGPCPLGADRQHEWTSRADNGVVECNFCQAAANVGLIALVPELLAALEDMLAAVGDDTEIAEERKEKARAAIAKATSPQAQ